MRILDIVPGTSVDGPGLRTSIYFAGCRHRCPGCHNPQSWDFAGGREMSVSEIVEEVEKNGFNVTFTGGDPLYLLEKMEEGVKNSEGSDNFEVSDSSEVSDSAELAKLPELLRLAAELRRRDYTIWCYTGFLYEQVASHPLMSRLFPYLEVLVDGPFVESLRDISLHFRGSSNQRLIDILATQKSGHPVLWRHPW